MSRARLPLGSAHPSAGVGGQVCGFRPRFCAIFTRRLHGLKWDRNYRNTGY